MRGSHFTTILLQAASDAVKGVTAQQCAMMRLLRYRFELVDPQREVPPSDAMVVGPERGAMAVRIRRRGR